MVRTMLAVVFGALVLALLAVRGSTSAAQDVVPNPEGPPPQAAPQPAPQGNNDSEAPQEQTEDEAFAAMEAAQADMRARSRSGEQGFEMYRPLAEAAAAYLAFHPADISKARQAA